MSKVKERLAARKGLVKKTLDGIGDVWFQLISTEHVLAFSDLPNKEFAAAVIAASLVEEDGAAVYTKEEVLNEPYADMRPIRDVAFEVNNLGKGDAKKNGEPPPGGSPT